MREICTVKMGLDLETLEKVEWLYRHTTCKTKADLIALCVKVAHKLATEGKVTT